MKTIMDCFAKNRFMKRAHSNPQSLIVLILILLLFSVSTAYAEWTVTTFPNPNPNLSSWLSQIDFIDSPEGWALQAPRRLYHYSNGTWTTSGPPELSSPLTRQLCNIQFISRDEGWAAGYIEEQVEGGPNHQRGVLYHYVNGDWTTVSLPDISSEQWRLFGIQFFSSNEGWVLGMDDFNRRIIVLQYTDGEWKTYTFTKKTFKKRLSLLDPFKIAFTSPNEGWVICASGLILHYLNGEWKETRLPLNRYQHLSDAYFVSPDEGWAVANLFFNEGFNSTGFLLHYLNGKWRFITPPDLEGNWTLAGVSFISPNEGWAVGYAGGDGLLLHYLNGSWTRVDIPILESLLGSSFSDVELLSSGEGWIAGHVDVEWHIMGWQTSGLLLKYSFP